jgi:Putative auto-transporter adhesin, head GIN domain/Outer membrane protein beta-barrel domain
MQINLKTKKMKKIFIITLGLVLMIINQLSGQNDTLLNAEKLQGVNKVYIEGFSIVTIQQSDTPILLVNEGEKMDVKVEGDKLFIEANQQEVFISLKQYQEISIEGVSSLKSKGVITSDNLIINTEGAAEITLDLDVNSITTNLEGAAEVKLKGKANIHILNVEGAAEINAKALITKITKANLEGVAQADVFASEEISGEVSGLSKLNYIGEPKIINIEAAESAEILSIIIDTSLYVIGDSEIYIVDDNDPEDNNPIDKNIIIKKKNKFNGHWGGLELGCNILMNNSFEYNIPSQYSYLDQKIGKSTSFSINLIEKNINLIKNKFGLLTGLGIQFQNYRFDNNVVLSGDSASLFGYHELDQTKEYLKSKLVVSYLTVPLIFEFQTNKKRKANSFHIGAGAIFGLRIGSHSKTLVYDDGKQKQKDKDDFHTSPFKYELTFRMGWSKFNLFANYSLASLFSSGKGPELYPFTVGIALLSW